jgi:hypothetical protein
LIQEIFFTVAAGCLWLLGKSNRIRKWLASPAIIVVSDRPWSWVLSQ